MSHSDPNERRRYNRERARRVRADLKAKGMNARGEPYPTKPCACCGREFTSTRRDAVYCSRKCRRAKAPWWERTCPRCATEFAASHPTAIYCSRQCAQRHKRGTVRELKRWSDDEIIAALRWAAERFDRSPTVEEFRMLPGPSPLTVAHHFGTWNKGLAAAGLDPRPTGVNASLATKSQKHSYGRNRQMVTGSGISDHARGGRIRKFG